MTGSHAEEALLRPYAHNITTAPPTRPVPKVLRWVPFVPGTGRLVVAWGNSPAYALKARQYADDYAADNGLEVAASIVSLGQEVGTATLYAIAEKSAVARGTSYGIAWWVLLPEDVRGIDLDALLARQPAAPFAGGDWVATRPGATCRPSGGDCQAPNSGER